MNDESENNVESEGALQAIGVPASWNFYVVSLAAMLALVEEYPDDKHIDMDEVTAGSRPG